ncbi:MAG: hypothetical protein PHT40_03840 [Patescibacteria group bacterium]|nr:hypothetical protein [Patescibacteria group bacterium]
MHYYDPYYPKNLPVIPEKEAIKSPMSFKAPSRAALLRVLTRVNNSGNCAENTLLGKIPLGKKHMKVMVGDPFIGMSIERKVVKICNIYFLKVCFRENVSFMSKICENHPFNFFQNYCTHVELL